jgi:hypothetical protein
VAKEERKTGNPSATHWQLLPLAGGNPQSGLDEKEAAQQEGGASSSVVAQVRA